MPFKAADPRIFHSDPAMCDVGYFPPNTPRMYQRLAAALLPAMLDAGYFAPNTLLVRCYGQF